MDGLKTKTDSDLLRLVESGEIDFLDFGCSEGGSYEFALRRFNARRGIGLDIDPKKVEKARARGAEAYVADATQVELPSKCVKFVVMSHFLEHLPESRLAAKCVKVAIAAASDFVLIRIPYYDANVQLLPLGFKLYSADWSGHPNLMTSYDIWRSVRAHLELDEVSLAIFGRFRITDSADTSIVPLLAPVDTRKKDLESFSGKKEKVSFPFAMYKELVGVIIRKKKGSVSRRLDSIVDKIGSAELLYSF